MDRKEAIRKFKEQTPTRGVFALRSTATGRVWVGAFTNLEAMRNRLWFTLRQGGHRDQALQEDWNLHGEPAFQYEVLEKLKEDVCSIEVADLLKEGKKRWVERLGAQPLL